MRSHLLFPSGAIRWSHACTSDANRPTNCVGTARRLIRLRNTEGPTGLCVSSLLVCPTEFTERQCTSMARGTGVWTQGKTIIDRLQRCFISLLSSCACHLKISAREQELHGVPVLSARRDRRHVTKRRLTTDNQFPKEVH